MLLIRDAPDLQVFMLRRNLRSAFAAGAYVFPGGAVDPDDSDVRLDPGPGPGANPIPGPFRVAAIRETFEEAGVLLARDASSGAPVDAAAVQPAREALCRGDRSFAQIVDDLDVVLDTESLLPIGRFITPRGAPRRFDTWFFVAPAPDGHAYRHDDGETVESLWIRPDEALDRGRRGGFELITPTWCSLSFLASFPRVEPLFDAIRAAWQQPSPLDELYPGRGWLLRVDSDARPGRGGSPQRRRTPA